MKSDSSSAQQEKINAKLEQFVCMTGFGTRTCLRICLLHHFGSITLSFLKQHNFSLGIYDNVVLITVVSIMMVSIMVVLVMEVSSTMLFNHGGRNNRVVNY